MTASFVCLVPHLFQASICTIKSAAASAAAAMKLSIKTFVEDNKHSYPCSTVPCARQGCCPKWLLAASKNKQVLVLRKTGHCVIKTSCLNHNDLQNLMMSGDGIPLPVEFAEVVDGLETWGGIHWTCWLEKSLKLMHEHMREDNMCGGVGLAKMRLFHDCILLAVQWKAGCRFHTNSPEHNLALSNWNACFWARCRDTCSFHEFAYDSMNCVRDMVESVDREDLVTIALESIELARLSSVHCVPESPVSLTTRSGESTQEQGC